MPDISQIQMPSGTIYTIKDTIARQQAGGGIIIRGTTTTALEDDDTTNPITINGESYTAVANDAVFYGHKEFVFDGTMWHEFGDMSGLGALAEKDSASGNFTPSGSVSQPTFTGTQGNISVTGTPAGSVSAPTISVSSAGSTATVHNPTSENVVKSIDTAAPTATAPSNPVTLYNVTGETLVLNQVGCTKGDSISTQDITVKTGDASYEASQPTFTGSELTSTGTFTPAGSVSQPTFTGTQGTVTVS